MNFNYQKIDGKLYRIQENKKIFQGGFDCNNIIEYEIINEKFETELKEVVS